MGMLWGDPTVSIAHRAHREVWSDREEARQAVVRALCNIPDPLAVATLKRLQDSKDPVIRDMVAAALRRTPKAGG
jgi:HEAT repeat protein